MSDPRLAEIARYFEEVGDDYGAWCADFNLHFGCWRPGVNPLRLAALIAQLNREVIERLRLPRDAPARVLDLGCGLGALARCLAAARPLVRVDGFSISPWQVEAGARLTAASGLADRVRLQLADYAALPTAAASADAAYAVESACYAAGPGKRGLLREAARALRPGGRLLIADGFRRHDRGLPAWLQGAYRGLLRCWAIEQLPQLGAVRQELAAAGFAEVQVEDLSWRVAPSLLHAPWVGLRFLWRHWRQTGALQLTPARWGNVLAPWPAMLVGLARRHFAYLLITAVRR